MPNLARVSIDKECGFFPRGTETTTPTPFVEETRPVIPKSTGRILYSYVNSRYSNPDTAIEDIQRIAPDKQTVLLVTVLTEKKSTIVEEKENFFHCLNRDLKGLISSFKSKDLFDEVVNKSWFVKEYCYTSNAIDHHQSLLELGNILFHDARPTNEIESTGIKKYWLSKSRIIPYKKIK